MDERNRRTAPPGGRRRFVRLLGAAGLAGAAWGLGATLGPRDARGQAPSGGEPDTPPEVIEESGHLFEVATGRLPEGALDAAQAGLLRKELEGAVRVSKALREKKLANAVEPDTVFRAAEPVPPAAPAPTEPPAAGSEGGR